MTRDSLRVVSEPATPEDAGAACHSRQMVLVRSLVTLLLAAFWSMDLAIYLYLRRPGAAAPPAIQAMVIGFVFGQTSVASVLLVWGRINAAARFLVTVLWLAGVAWLGAAAEKNPVADWLGGIAILCGLALGPLIAANLAGWRLDRTARPAADDMTLAAGVADGVTGRRRTTHRRPGTIRFTVGGLLGLTTATAILLGIARYANFPVLSMWEHWQPFALLLGFALVCGGIVLHVGAGTIWRVAAGVFAALDLLGTAALCGWCLTSEFSALVLRMNLLVHCVNSATIVAAALVLRVAGIGLVKQAERGQA